MRIAKACKQCRINKRRCRGGNLGPCEQCTRKNVSCSLNSDMPIDRNRNCALPRKRNQVTSSSLLVELVDDYLEILHGKPHTLFHPQRLRQSVRDGTLSNRILYSIAGLVARFHRMQSVREKKDDFMELGKIDLKAKIDDFSLETVQACVLLGHLFGAEDDRNLESLFFAVGFRIAHIIKLDQQNADDDPITREEKVRTWWSLYMIDRWSAAGLNVSKQLSDDTIVPLPMEEVEFYGLDYNKPSINTVSLRTGFWAQMVALARIFGRIQDLHKQHADGQIHNSEIEGHTEQLSEDLQNFVSSLPAGLHVNEGNLSSYASTGLGRDLVALHLGFHHYSTLLYFPFLDLDLSGCPSQPAYANQCKRNAAELSELLMLSHRINGCKPAYLTVAHMTVVSSSALLHELLFGDQALLEVTRFRLNANFQTLMELQQLWPSARMMTDRLFAFQDMCLRSSDPNTHRADRWMVKFLLRHAFPIDAKDSESSRQSRQDLANTRQQHANDVLSVLLRT